MKAIAVETFGAQPRLMDLPDPEPGPGEVLVAIDTAAINPMDWKAAQGAFRVVMENEFPLVLGFDGAGRVEALGPGAGRFTIGDVTGTNHGEHMGRPPTGRCVTYSEIFIFRFVDGPIAETWGIVDVFSQLKQLGVIQ